jgi:hypothetical protein
MAATNKSRNFVGGFRRGRPLLGRAAVSFLQMQIRFLPLLPIPFEPSSTLRGGIHQEQVMTPPTFAMSRQDPPPAGASEKDLDRKLDLARIAIGCSDL